MRVRIIDRHFGFSIEPTDKLSVQNKHRERERERLKLFDIGED